MLTRFEVENYKNFKNNIILDFKNSGGYKFNTDCLYNNIISKIMIYGRNASGKTNFGSAIVDICDYPFFRRTNQTFINADTDESTAKFKYCFEFDNDSVEYIYEKDGNNCYTKEVLYVNDTLIFSIDYINKKNTAGDLASISVETIIVDRFFTFLENREEDLNQGRGPSFLRWIVANSTLEPTSVLIKIITFIDRMQLVTVGNLLPMSMPTRIQSHMLNNYDDEFVKELEFFFNQMGVECNLILKVLPEGEKQLYFNYKNPIPFFDNASSGTIALFNLYRRVIMPAKKASLIYLDEFDAFYHYEMSENILKYLKLNYPKTQIIITTHNTNLMANRLSRPDCLYILSTYGKLTPLNHATTRELREGHNLEKLYISGEFEKYE